MISTPPLCGIDISHYQGTEIEAKNFIAGQSGLVFIICKATEGANSPDNVDKDFATNWSTIQQKGFTRGAYHYFHVKDEPVEQVGFFLETVNAVSHIGKEDLPPIVDFENNASDSSLDGNTDMAYIQGRLLTFLNTLKERTGRTPIIYTGADMCRNYLNDKLFAPFPLYVAEYGVSAPNLEGTIWGENGWTFWQRGTITIDIDTNKQNTSFSDDSDVFNGDETSFKDFVQTH